MGCSLVESPSDLGGAFARHRKLQALLDELAVQFIDNGWSIKELVRSILVSATYQTVQPSLVPNLCCRCKENSLYGAVPSANGLRVAFAIARCMQQGKWTRAFTARAKKFMSGPYSHRRMTVYAHIDRQNLPGVFRNFDVAVPMPTVLSDCKRRYLSRDCTF